jgi:ABC-type multidrug transport system ATPase subunit
MHRELTVREILKSYALMRLPRTLDNASVERVVQDVIEALQVAHVQAEGGGGLSRESDVRG